MIPIRFEQWGLSTLNDECEWTYKNLFDEALANYQSLQGMQVDWLSLELDGLPQELVRIKTREGNVFRFEIAAIGDHESGPFDGLFPFL